MEPVQLRLLRYIQTSLESDLKDLDRINSVCVRDAESSWDNYSFDGLTIVRGSPTESGGTVGKDDYGYQFAIVTSTGNPNGSDVESQSWPAEFQKIVRDRFSNQRVPAAQQIPECFICAVRFGSFLDKRLLKFGKSVSSMTVICWCREVRPELS